MTGIIADAVTVTVSIGRNAHAAQVPLEPHNWESFRAQVRTLLTAVIDGTLHVDRARSVGQWDGKAEESATFVADVPQHSLATLEAGLTLLARTWGQEKVALTVGKTRLVG